MQETVAGWLTGAVLPGAGALLLLVGTSLAKHYIGKLKDERARKLLQALVEAAEQLYGPGKGEAKRRFVRERLKQQGLTTVSREDVEAAVYQLNKG